MDIVDSSLPYLQALAGIPLPTPEQTTAFAEYVSGAHSWYKHLPLQPPGARFVFYLDPNSGRQIVRDKKRQWVHEDMPEGEQFFHYNQMPTAEYRRRFGIWAYRSNAAPTFILSGGKPEFIGETGLAIVNGAGEHVSLPAELASIGVAFVTGCMSSRDSARMAFFLYQPKPNIAEAAPHGSDVELQWLARYQRLFDALGATKQRLEAESALRPKTDPPPPPTYRQPFEDDADLISQFVAYHDDRRKYELASMESAMNAVLAAVVAQV